MSELIENHKGWFEFKDVNKIYAEYDNGNLNFPFRWECIVGKNKKEIKKLFGEPHREVIMSRLELNIFVYCFSEACRKEIDHTTRQKVK